MLRLPPERAYYMWRVCVCVCVFDGGITLTMMVWCPHDGFTVGFVNRFVCAVSVVLFFGISMLLSRLAIFLNVFFLFNVL